MYEHKMLIPRNKDYKSEVLEPKKKEEKKKETKKETEDVTEK